MIAIFHCCTSCQSTDVIRNGKNAAGNAKFRCKSCGFSGVIQTKRV
ncbi:MAG: IS1 family transposase [Hymenobacteraceae bacterium]|nr:IS1 family transposase [Hymenobacteraceae bacterium]